MKISISSSGFLYHVTMVRNLKRVKTYGMELGRGSRQDFYSDYSRGKVFLTSWSGVSYWWDYLERRIMDETDNPEEGWMPICLRTPFPVDVQVDELGTRDSRHKSYFIKHPIDADEIQFWDGSWKPVSRVNPDKLRKEVLANSTYEEDDGYWDIYYEHFKPDSP